MTAEPDTSDIFVGDIRFHLDTSVVSTAAGLSIGPISGSLQPLTSGDTIDGTLAYTTANTSLPVGSNLLIAFQDASGPGDPLFGWIEYSLDGSQLTVHNVAYADTPGVPINAGATTVTQTEPSPDAPIAAPLLDQAVDFNGTDQHIEAGRGPADELAISGDVTVEAWINLNEMPVTATFDTILAFADVGATSAENVQYMLRIDEFGDIQYVHEHGAAGTVVSHTFDTNLSANAWTHVAMSRDATAGTVDLLIDGDVVGTFDYAGVPHPGPDGGETAQLIIGATAASNGNFDGQMFDVRVYDALRSQADIPG